MAKLRPMQKDSPGAETNPSAPRTIAAPNLLIRLIQRHPFMVWGMVWAGAILISGLAWMNLLNPNGSEPPKTAHSPSVVAQQPDQPAPDQASYLWLLGAIVLSCAAGSMVVSNRFRPSSPGNYRLIKRSQGRRPTPNPAAGKQPAPAVPAPEIKQVAIVPVKAEAPLATVTSQVTKPQITVVPPEEMHPLDWGENSLADLMDLRKQRPLSSLLSSQ